MRTAIRPYGNKKNPLKQTNYIRYTLFVYAHVYQQSSIGRMTVAALILSQ